MKIKTLESILNQKTQKQCNLNKLSNRIDKPFKIYRKSNKNT